MKAKKEKGIIISLTEEELNDRFTHYRKADGRFAWWETTEIPTELKECTKFPLYVAVEGKVRGFFMVHETYTLPDEEGYGVVFYPETRTQIEDGEQIEVPEGWQYYPKEK